MNNSFSQLPLVAKPLVLVYKTIAIHAKYMYRSIRFLVYKYL